MSYFHFDFLRMYCSRYWYIVFLVFVLTLHCSTWIGTNYLTWKKKKRRRNNLDTLTWLCLMIFFTTNSKLISKTCKSQNVIKWNRVFLFSTLFCLLSPKKLSYIDFTWPRNIIVCITNTFSFFKSFSWRIRFIYFVNTHDNYIKKRSSC